MDAYADKNQVGKFGLAAKGSKPNNSLMNSRRLK